MHIDKTLPEREFRIYVLTARAEDEHRAWSGSIRNLELLEKPVSVRKLVARLHDYFSSQCTDVEETCLKTQSVT